MKMHVIAGINPLQPQQLERLHEGRGIYTSKMCGFVTWSPGEPLLWINNKKPLLFARQLGMFMLQTGFGCDLPLPRFHSTRFSPLLLPQLRLLHPARLWLRFRAGMGFGFVLQSSWHASTRQVTALGWHTGKEGSAFVCVPHWLWNVVI